MTLNSRVDALSDGDVKGGHYGTACASTPGCARMLSLGLNLHAPLAECSHRNAEAEIRAVIRLTSNFFPSEFAKGAKWQNLQLVTLMA